MNYPKAYALLVGTVSSAIDEIGKSRVVSQEVEKAVRMFKNALIEVEEMYMRAEEQERDS